MFTAALGVLQPREAGHAKEGDLPNLLKFTLPDLSADFPITPLFWAALPSDDALIRLALPLLLSSAD